MTVSLRDITRDNWRACAKLSLAENQHRFVTSNAFSLAQSKYEPEFVPLAIYLDDILIGFTMYKAEDYGLARVWFIERLMIDRLYQGQGHGRAAMQLLIDRLKAVPGYNAILISFVPENDAARRLYTGLGFQDTGEIEAGELVFRLPL